MLNKLLGFFKKKTDEELYQESIREQAKDFHQGEHIPQDHNNDNENPYDKYYTDDRSSSQEKEKQTKQVVIKKFITDILNDMSPAKKRKLKKQITYIGIPAFCILLLLIYQGISSPASHGVVENLPDEQDVKVLSGATNGTNLDNSFLDANEAEQTKQNEEIKRIQSNSDKQVQLLQMQIKNINDRFIEREKQNNQEKIDLMNQIQGLEQKTQDMTKSYKTQMQTLMKNQSNMPQGNYQGSPQSGGSSNGKPVNLDKNGNIVVTPMINRIALTQSQSNVHDIRYYLPTGSYAKATIISGVDADVGVGSQGDPRPILFRITNKAISADVHKRHNLFDVRGCTVTGAAYGDLSSEKVYVRLQKMTCSRNRGKVFEFKVEGYTAGDGKTGIRGHLISRMGGKLAKAGVAGFISGMGSGISDFLSGASGAASSGISINTGGSSDQKSSPKLADILKGGVAKGTSNTADMLAKYYIKRAELMNPIISLQSGKQVELVFLKGVDLKDFLKHKIS